MDHEKLLKRLEVLKRKGTDNASTEEEALSALTKMRQLMVEHGIEESELNQGSEGLKRLIKVADFRENVDTLVYYLFIESLCELLEVAMIPSAELKQIAVAATESQLEIFAAAKTLIEDQIEDMCFGRNFEFRTGVYFGVGNKIRVIYETQRAAEEARREKSTLPALISSRDENQEFLFETLGVKRGPPPENRDENHVRELQENTRQALMTLSGAIGVMQSQVIKVRNDLK